MKKRFGMVAIGGIILLFLSCVSVFAISEKSVNYYFLSKKVSVRVVYYVETQGTYIPLEDEGLTVMPGEFISRIPVIYNEGMNCYIRAKVTMISEKEPSVPITIENIVGMDETWIPIGDYFYCKDVFLEDEDIKVFDGICMPTEWVEQIDCGNVWEVQVKVDAIQAEHLTPNFQSEDPWGEQKEGFRILDAKEDEVENDSIEDEACKDEFVITIDSETDAFQIKIEESFQTIGSFVPGDEKECKIRISNLDAQENVLYMQAEVTQVNRLLEETKVTILWECEGKNIVLYQGTASKICDKLEKITLNIPGCGNGLLRVFVSLPQNVENDCAAWEGSLRFTFSDEKHSFGNYEVQNDELIWMEDEECEDKVVNSDNVWNENFIVQTGDDNKIWNAIVGLGIGVCLFFLYLWKGKRGSHDL